MKEWYQIILERGVTHTSEDLESPPVLIQSRHEESQPEKDFSNSYRLCRLFGFSPEQKTFLFKMVQNLLPTQERLHRLRKVPSPCCRFCDCPEDTTEHLLACAQSAEVTAPLLACLSGQVSTSNITNKEVINMSITALSPGNYLQLGWLQHVWLSFGRTGWQEMYPDLSDLEQNCWQR